jgi:hypothetical protein
VFIFIFSYYILLIVGDGPTIKKDVNYV